MATEESLYTERVRSLPRLFRLACKSEVKLLSMDNDDIFPSRETPSLADQWTSPLFFDLYSYLPYSPTAGLK